MSAKPIASRLSSWGHTASTPRRGPDESQGESNTLAFLDLYTQEDDELLRLSIVQEVTSFPPVPADSPHGLSAMRNLVAECKGRFDNAYFDHRLVDMRLRGTASVVTGAPITGPARVGFSYATEALAGLLGSLSPAAVYIGSATGAGEPALGADWGAYLAAWRGALATAIGYVLDQKEGLLAYGPHFLLAAAGLASMWRTRRAEAVSLARLAAAAICSPVKLGRCLSTTYWGIPGLARQFRHQSQ